MAATERLIRPSDGAATTRDGTLTIQDLGSLGEIVAAIATVATLAYLAVQIRHFSLSMKSDAMRGTSDGDASVLALAQDAELNRIFVTGLSDYGSLDPLERIRFGWVLGAMIGSASRNYGSVTLGIVSESHFRDHQSGQLMMLETPGGSEFWHGMGHAFPTEFRDFVSRYVKIRPPSSGSQLGGRAGRRAAAADTE